MARKKQIKKTSFMKAKTLLTDKAQSLAHAVGRYPILITPILFLVYLFVFQRHFLLSSDVWAETHMEYLQNAIRGRASDIVSLGWAGYLAIIPAFLVKIFVVLNGPIGYVDYYYQVIIIAFAISVSTFAVSRLNRELLGTFYYRFLFGLSLLMLLYEKSTFTFINIWYAGFVPIILLGLSHCKLDAKRQVAYTVWGVLLALTKPSLLLLPFVMYRAYRAREYVSNGLIALAVSLQTYLMLFEDPRQTSAQVSHDIFFTLKALFVGCGVELLKLFRIVPTNLIYVFIANLILAGLFVIAIKRIGVLRSGLLLFGLLFSVYAYVMAPDSPTFASLGRFQETYFFNYKIQREYLIYVFMLMLIFIALPFFDAQIKKLKNTRYTNFAVPVLTTLLTMRLFIPIDVQSSGVASNIDSFRSAMSSGESVCVPIPPTPAYFPNALWQFSSNIDICHARNFELNPDYSSLNTPISPEFNLNIPNDTPFSLKTVYVVVRNTVPRETADFALTDTISGVTYYGHIPARDSEELNFIPVNVAGQPYRHLYEFRVTGPPSLRVGTFIESAKPLYYPFFGESKVPYHRTRR